MGFIGIGAVLALLLAFLTLRAKTRHDRVIRLIHETPVTPIAELAQSFTAHPDPSTPTHAAVQGRVAAREQTRLTAPITGSSCVAYWFRVWEWPVDIDITPEDCIEDSKCVPWAVDDGTGLALGAFAPFNPNHWPGWESTKDTFKNTPQHLGRVISHYGPLPSPPSHVDLWWEVSILREFANEVFLLGPCTVQEGCAHFQLGSDSLLWFGSRADALAHEQLSLRSSTRRAVIWFTVFVGNAPIGVCT